VDGATSEREGLRQFLLGLPTSLHAAHPSRSGAAPFLQLIGAGAMLQSAWPPAAFAFDGLAISPHG
jgi:hypothetical protein